jgi:MtrB/PioB family decaheme-associated outer membrane protein
MNKTQQSFRLTLLSAALLSAFAPARAEDDDIARLIRPNSAVSVGVGNWSKDRPQQGIYDGMREDGVYGLLDAEVVKRDDATGTWYTFFGRNLGLDTREFKAEYLRQGQMGISLDYSRIPRDNPFTINTGLQGFGSTTQTVTNITPGTGSNITLGTHRDRVGLQFYRNLRPGLDFNVSFKNEDKNGTRHWGRGGAPEFAVEPIDSTTRQLEAILSYTGERFQLSGGYYGSWYDNAHSLVTAVGSSTFFLSLPLDNQAHQLFVEGGYNFTPTTRGTFKVSRSRATQDEHLPTKDIAGLSLASSPESLNGKLNTTLVQLGLTARPLKDLSLVANLRYHDLQDDTPVARFVQTNPACGAGQCVDNTPFSYKTVTGKLEGTYRLPLGFSLTGGVEHRQQDRSVPVANANGPGGTDTQRVVPMRAKIDETSYRVEARRAMSETVNGSLAFVRSERDGSSYVSAAAGPGGAPSDLINPIHIADRDRNKWRLAVDWTPLENLSLQFGYENARDEYGSDAVRKYGVRDGDATLYSLDATYSVSEDWQVTAWYVHDRTKATQLGRRDSAAGGSLADKDAWLEDTGNSFGLGLRGNAAARLKVGADLQWTRSHSKYPETLTFTGAGTTLFPANFVGPLPDIVNKLTRLSLFADYAIHKNADVRMELVHERWRTDDWTWLFGNGTPFVYGATPTDGTTVMMNPKQVSNFVGVRYIYRFW